MKLVTLFLLTVIIAVLAVADPLLWGPQGVSVSGSGRIKWYRTLARDSSGSVLVVWSDLHTGSREIYAELVAPDGALPWNGPRQITNDHHEQSWPAVTATDGGWIVVWIDYRNIPHNSSGGEGGELWAQKLNMQGQPQWTEGGIRLEGQSNIAQWHLMAFSDGVGGATVAYSGMCDGSDRVNVVRVASSGEILWPRVGIDTQGLQQFTAAPDGAGGVLLAWNESSHAKATRITALGAQPWGVVSVWDTVTQGESPAIAADGNGGCYLAWSGSVNHGQRDIVLQRINADGELQWPGYGIRACAAAEAQAVISAVTSFNNGAADGCLLTWLDERNLHSPVFYGQKISPDGVAQWDSNGVMLCYSFTDEGPISLASDGHGGLAVASDDWEGNALGWNIYALHLNAAGQSMWSSGGAVCLESGDQAFPTIVYQNQRFLIVFQDKQYGSEIRKILMQELDFNTGERIFPDAGRVLVSFAPSTTSSGCAAALSNGHSAFLWTSGQRAHYQILDAEGNGLLNADTAVILPDTAGLGYNFLDAQAAQVVPDNNGGFYAVLGTGNEEMGFAGFAGHIAADGRILGSGKARQVWTDADLGYNYGVSACADGEGGCYVIFQLWDENPGLFVLRLNTLCQPEWTAPAQLDAGTIYEMSKARVITAPDGGCLAVWLNGAGQCHASRTSTDGNILWTTSFGDTTLFFDGVNPKITSDGQGGAYCTWVRMADAPEYYTTRIQHFSPTGEELWEHGGKPLSSRTGNQLQSWSLLDDAGDLIVACTEEVPSSSSGSWVSAYKFSPEGTPLWSDSGRVISNALDCYEDPVMISDGAGGSYAAWESCEDGAHRIYATHLNAEGFSGPDLYWQQNAGGLISDSSPISYASHPLLTRGQANSALVFWQQDIGQSSDYLADYQAQRIVPGSLSAGKPQASLPTHYTLYQNYPNPFNPTTQITFDLPQAGPTTLTVFDLLGRQVATLASGHLSAGEHRAELNASLLASGVYFYRLHSGSFTGCRKMVVLK